MSIPARRMHAVLVNKLGFYVEERRHRVYLLEVRGKTVAQTLMSHGARELDDRLLGLVARQMGVTLSQLKALVKCTLSRDDYLRLLGCSPEWLAVKGLM
jgi:hypothetical protein